MSRSYQRDRSIAGSEAMQKALSRRRKLALAASVATAAVAPVAMGAKNVDVQRVVTGSAQISTVGNKTIIRAADRTIIDFKSFNVASNESVQFIQPTSTSRVLDRINSQTPSKIDGSISANGIVYFVNPSGVTFGPHSVVTASQIFTVGGSVSNANFLAGSNKFQVNAKVENDGSITASNGVALVGQQLVNNGTITASNGVVVFALGGDVYVGSKDSSIIAKVNPQTVAAAATPPSTLDNTGTVTAADEASMASGDMYATVLNIGGQVTAAKISVASGKQGTSIVTGTLDASNAKGKGGRIEVTGNAVALTGATVNASGSTGGGDVRIGGDFHGKGTLLTSHQTLVDAASKITADSTRTGSGGTVAVWSDGNTGVHGSISAAGTTGTGGFIETSAKGVLDISQIAVNAIGSKAGQWLLDPTDVDITDTVAPIGLMHEVNTGPNEDTYAPDSTTGMSYISPGTIRDALEAGTSVKIVTSPTGTFSNLGTIKVDTDGAIAVSYAAVPAKTPTLTLQADADINILAPISGVNGPLNVVLSSQTGVNIGTTGAINSIWTDGGYFKATAPTGNISIQAGNNGIATSGGDFNVQAPAGTVSISAPISTGGGKFISSSVNFTLSGPAGTPAIDTSVAGAVGGSVAITVAAPQAGPANQVTIDEPINTGGGTLTIAADQVVTTANGSITTSAPLAPSGTAGGNFSIMGPTGDFSANGVTLGAAVTTMGGSITINAARIDASTVTIDSSIPATVPGTFAGGGLIMLTGNTGPIALKTVTAGLADLKLQTLTVTGAISATNLEAADAIGTAHTIAISAPMSSVNAGTLTSEFGDTVGVSITSIGMTSATLPVQMSSLSLNVNPASGLNIASMGGLQFGNTNSNLTLHGTDSITAQVSITTSTAGGITIDGPLTVDGPMTLVSAQGITVATGANPVQIFHGMGQNGSLTLQSLGSGAMGTITLGAEIDASGPLVINSSADIAVNSPISINNALVSGASGSVSLTAVNGVTESGSGAITSTLPYPGVNALTLNGSGDFALGGANSVPVMTASIIGTGGAASLEFTNSGAALALNSVIVKGGIGNPHVSDITISAPSLSINGPVSADFGIALNTNSLSITTTGGGIQPTAVYAPTGTITISPTTDVNVYLSNTPVANALSISAAALDQLTASSVVISTIAGGTGIIDIGNGLGFDATNLTSPLTLQSSKNINVDLGTSGFTTGASQTYSGPVNVMSTGSAALLAKGASTITFSNTVSGPGGLNVTANGQITFANTVAGLNSLFVMSGTNIEIDGGAVTTTGTQTYASGVTLGTGTSTTTLTGSEIDIDAGVLPAAMTSQALTLAGVSTGGNFYISGQLGSATAPLSSVNTYSAGTPTITSFSGGANVYTSGSQTYGTVTLSGSTTLTTLGSVSPTISFMSTVDSVGDPTAALELSAAGQITFGAEVGKNDHLGSLIVDPTAGSVLIQSASIFTTGAQSYGVPVTLGNSADNVAINGSIITFNGTVGQQDPVGHPQSLVILESSGGTATFNEAINLYSLSTQSAPQNAPSTVEINTPTVTTTSGQTYNNAVTLGYQPVGGPAQITLSGSFITFNETLDADTSPLVPAQALVINTDSTSTGVTFNGAVGKKSDKSKLQSLTTNSQSGGVSSTNINGGYIGTSLFQHYNEPVFLTSLIAPNPNNSNITLAGSEITFASPVNGTTGNEALLISSTGGAITFNGIVGGLYSLTTGSGGSTFINTTGITASQTLTFNNAVTLQQSTALKATSAGSSITLNSVDDFSTAGSAGLTIISTDQFFNGIIGGQHALSNLTVNGTGTTHITKDAGANNVTINTVGDQIYQAPVRLSANTTLLSSGGGGTIQFVKTVDSDTSNTHYTLSANTTFKTIFGGSVGTLNELGSLTVNDPTLAGLTGTGGQTYIDGTNILTSGPQAYNNAVLIGTTTTATLKSDTNGSIKFGSTVDSASALMTPNLTVTASGGDVDFGDNVGATPLGALTVKASGNINIGGNHVLTPVTINTVGEQDYNGNVNLANDNASLTAGVLNLIKFFHSISGAFSLTTSGMRTEFDGAVDIGSLNVATGNTLIVGGSVTTSGAQMYSDGPVTLANATLASANTILTAGGDVYFHSTVDTDLSSGTAQNLQIMSQGMVTFTAAVGTIGSIPLGSLDVSANINTAINGGKVYTAGAQIYDHDVTLGNPVTSIIAGKDVTFVGTLQGVRATVPSALTIKSANQIFESSVGGVVDNGNMLISLDTFSTDGGSAQIDGGHVATSSYQFYHDLVTLDGTPAAGVALTTLTASSFDFTTNISAQSGAAANTQALVIDLDSTVASHIYFGGDVGDAPIVGQFPLLSLLTQDIGTGAGSTVEINAQKITTSGPQQYGEKFVVDQSATLTGTNVDFVDDVINGGKVTGPADLIVTASGKATFGGDVGESMMVDAPLNHLTVTQTGGMIDFKGSQVHTKSSQLYGNAMVMDGPTVTLTSDSSSVQFLSTLTGNSTALEITSVDQVFGNTVTLSSLQTNGTGAAKINGPSITTTLSQTYNDAVKLTGNAVLSGGNVTFSRTVDDLSTPGLYDLTVNSTGLITFADNVGNLSALRSLTIGSLGGTTYIEGQFVDTSGLQSYGEAVALNYTGAGSIALTAGSDVTFVSTLDALNSSPAQSLVVSSPSTIDFRDVVGGTHALQNLSTIGGATTKIDGGVTSLIPDTITTNGFQSFGGAVVLTNNTTLKAGGAVTFVGTVSGTFKLITDATQVTTFDSSVIIGSVTVDGITAIDGGTITTSTGDQLYMGAVTLGDQVPEVTKLTASISTNVGLANITFGSTLDTQTLPLSVPVAAQALDISATGLVTFGDNIGYFTGLSGSPSSALESLIVEQTASGTIAFNGLFVHTHAFQKYGNPMTMGATSNVTYPVTLYADAGVVQFSNTLTANNVQLTIRSVGQLFGKAVTLNSLETDGSNVAANGSLPAQIFGPTITTVAFQTYNDAVQLGGNTSLIAGGDVTFASTVDDLSTAGAFGLSVNSPGRVIFQDKVGNISALANLTIVAKGGTTLINGMNGGYVHTSGNQEYGEAVTLGANTIMLAGGEVNFATTLSDGGLVPGGASLVITSTGQIFGGIVGGGAVPLLSLQTNGNGIAQINGNRVITTLGQDYEDSVTLGSISAISSTANTILTASNVTFGSQLDADQNAAQFQALEVQTGPLGTVAFKGAVGSDSKALYSLVTDTLNTGGLESNVGTTLINGGSVRTTSFQYYQDEVILGASKLNAQGNANTLLTGSSVNFMYTLNGASGAVGQALEIDSVENGPATPFNENIGLLGSVNVSITPGQILFEGFVGSPPSGSLVPVAPLYSLTTFDHGASANGEVSIAGLSVTTTAGQTYNQPVVLVNDAVLTSSNGGEINMVSTVDSPMGGPARSLTISTSYLTVLGGYVGAQSPLKELIISGPGVTEINGGLPGPNKFTITTTLEQSYGDIVKLGGETALKAGGDVTFSDRVDDLTTAGAYGLSITSNNQIFNGEVGGLLSLASLTTNSPTTYAATVGSGLAKINGGKVITTGAQLFNDDVTLGFGLINAVNPVTTIMTGSSITFTRSVSAQGGAPSQALDANTVVPGPVPTGGLVIFDQAVGSGSLVGGDLYSLTTNDFAVNGVPLGNPGMTEINGGSLRTTAFQLYDGSVTLKAGTFGGGANTTLTAGTSVTFASTLNSDGSATVPQALEIDTQVNGTVIFNGAVGLYALTTTTLNPGTGPLSTTEINGGSIITSAFGSNTDSFQVYNDIVTLGQPGTPAPGGGLTTTLSGAAIEFNATLYASQAAAAQALVINTTESDASPVGGLFAGQIVFNRAVGGIPDQPQNPLFSLTTSDNGVSPKLGSVLINGMTIRTTDLQQYNQRVLLGNSAQLFSLQYGQIAFASTIDADASADALEVDTRGVTIFGGVIGGQGKLASLTTDQGGTTQINGGGILTVGATINTAQYQMFGDAVTLGQNAQLTAGGDVTFMSTVSDGSAAYTAAGGTVNIQGGASSLAITSQDQIFGGLVGGNNLPLYSLTTSTPTGVTGTVQVKAGVPGIGLGTITTQTFQTYGDAMQLFTDATLTSTTKGTIKLMSTVDSDAAPHALIVNTAGDTYFMGQVGGMQLLSALTTDDLNAPATERGGTTHIDGGLIKTQVDQSYYDAVAIGLSSTGNMATLNAAAGNVQFATILNQESNLKAGTVGLYVQSINQTFDGTVGLQTELLSLETVSNGVGVAAINGGLVQTTGHQFYDDAVTLGQSTQLNSFGDIKFAMTVQDGSAGAGQTAVSSLSIDSMNQIFQGLVGGNNLPLMSLSTTSTNGGLVELAAGFPAQGKATITTIGDQTFNDAASLYTDATLTSTTNGNILFVNAVDSLAAPRALTVNTVDTITFGGPVGGHTPLYSVITDDPAVVVIGNSTQTLINGRAIKTTSLQTFNDPVKLGNTTTLLATAGDVTFFSTLDANAAGNAFDLTVTSVNQVFKGLVGSIAPLHSLTTSTDPDATLLAANIGTAEIQGGLLNTGMAAITTTGDQSFNDAVKIYGNTTLVSTNAGMVKFGSTVDSDPTSRALTVNTAGTTIFDGPVGSNAALQSLTIDDPTAPANEQGGVTQINGGNILTTAFQTYNNAVTLGNETMLKAGTDETATQRDVTFVSTVDDAPASAGKFGLTISSLNQIFEAPVGANSQLQTLTTSSDPNATLQAVDQGTVQIKAGLAAAAPGMVVTALGQTYTDATVLFTNTTLTSTASGAITFAQTVDSDATATPRDLTVNTKGNTTFASAVGSKNQLQNLVTDAPTAPPTELGGTTAINGGTVNTMLLQTYNDAVTLGQTTTVAGTNVSFLGNLDSTFSLTVMQDATFGGLVGSKNQLAFITVMGSTAIVQGTIPNQNGDSITTVGSQTYQGAMTLGVDASLNSTKDSVTIQSTVDGMHNLAVTALNSKADVTIDGTVGGSTILNTLRLAASQITVQQTNTLSAQSYDTTGTFTAKGQLNGESIDATAAMYVLNGAVTAKNQYYTATSALPQSYTMAGIYKSANGGIELDAPYQGGISLAEDTVIDAADNITLNVSSILGSQEKLSLYAGTVGSLKNYLIGTTQATSTPAADDSTQFNSPSEAPTLVTPPGTIMVYAAHITTNDMNLGWYDDGLMSTDQVHVSNVTTSPATSSVVFRRQVDDHVDGALQIIANDKFTMDRDVKMSVVGYTPVTTDGSSGLNLVLPDLAGGKKTTATLSDINTEGDLTIKADRYVFDKNDASAIVTNLTNGDSSKGVNTSTLADPTVDFVATGVLKMQSNIKDTPPDWGDPQKLPSVNFAWNFATSTSFAANLLNFPGLSADSNSSQNDGHRALVHEFTTAYFSTTFYPGDNTSNGIQILHDPAAYLADATTSQTAAKLLYGNANYAVTPDFKADGVIADTPNTAQTTAGVLPILRASAGLTGAQMTELLQMKISARPVSPAEVIDGLDGRRLYVQEVDDPEATIAVDRLDNDVTQQVLNTYDQLISDDATGRVSGQQQWTDTIKSQFANAWNKYNAVEPHEFTPESYIAAMMADPHARQKLQVLRMLLDQIHGTMGLTDREYLKCRRFILSNIAPDWLGLERFYPVIFPKNGYGDPRDQTRSQSKPQTKAPAPPSQTPDDKKQSDKPKPPPVVIPPGDSASIRRTSEVAIASR